MFRRICRSIAFRLKMARFGIWYTTSKSFSSSSVTVAGKRISLSFPEQEQAVLEHELGKILFSDCYDLKSVPSPVQTVLDIGANVGLFAVAARHHFKRAVIHCYEPNQALKTYLAPHCQMLGAQYFMEAVGNESSPIELATTQNSLHTKVHLVKESAIHQIAFRDAIQRIGGTADLVKLDCEGAEWAMFEDPEPWHQVRYLTMEYHLWANPGMTVAGLVDKLKGLGLVCRRVEPSANGSFGLLQASRQLPKHHG